MTALKVLITGGSRGIGRACALQFASIGATVAICARGESDLRALQREATGLPGSIEFAVADAEDLEGFVEVVRQLDALIGGTDVLVNNVGGGGRWGNPLVAETPTTTWEEVMSKNFFTTVRATDAVLNGMQERGFGRVLVISSLSGREADGRPWFVSAKAAQVAYVRSMAHRREFGRQNVAFVCIAPGATYTETSGWNTWLNTAPDEYLSFAESLPLGRLLLADEVAQVVVFSSGPVGLTLSGSCIQVDGGEGVAI